MNDFLSQTSCGRKSLLKEGQISNWDCFNSQVPTPHARQRKKFSIWVLYHLIILIWFEEVRKCLSTGGHLTD
jgi:hypothetical protein